MTKPENGNHVHKAGYWVGMSQNGEKFISVAEALLWQDKHDTEIMNFLQMKEGTASELLEEKTFVDLLAPEDAAEENKNDAEPDDGEVPKEHEREDSDEMQPAAHLTPEKPGHKQKLADVDEGVYLGKRFDGSKIHSKGISVQHVKTLKRLREELREKVQRNTRVVVVTNDSELTADGVAKKQMQRPLLIYMYI